MEPWSEFIERNSWKTLQELCLNVVVNKFDRFLNAFNKTDDPKLKNLFEFLQRKFSNFLMSELYSRKTLHEECTGLLINKHLQFLNFEWLLNRSFPETENEYIIPIEKALSQLEYLEIINISKYCTDRILENLTKCCKNIVEIDMRNSNVTDNGVKYLCQDKNGQVPCVQLKKILIEKTNVTNEGLNCLIQFLPSLEIIDSPSIFGILYSLHKEDFYLKSVQNYNLVELDILKLDNLEWHVDLLRVCFTVCPKLKSLSCCIFSEEQLAVIKNDLDRLHLKFIGKARNININSFLKLKGSSLSCLSIYNSIMSISVLAASCPKLKQLSIGRVTFPDNDDYSNALRAFNSIKHCTIKYIKDEISSNNAIYYLLASKSLQSISFFSGDITRAMYPLILNSFKNLCNIKVISFESLTLDCNFLMDVLSNCPSLTTLNLSHCVLLGLFAIIPQLFAFAETLPNKPIITAIEPNY